MQILGVPMAAPAFLPEHENIREFNPGGFYELDDMFGIDHHLYKGMGVKLFGAQLYGTDKQYISKLIWVVRNRDEAIESYEKMRPRLKHSYVSSEKVFDANIALIKACVDKDTMIVKLKDIKEKPEEFISNLSIYLHLHPNEAQIRRARKNIT